MLHVITRVGDHWLLVYMLCAIQPLGMCHAGMCDAHIRACVCLCLEVGKDVPRHRLLCQGAMAFLGVHINGVPWSVGPSVALLWL